MDILIMGGGHFDRENRKEKKNKMILAKKLTVHNKISTFQGIFNAKFS